MRKIINMILVTFIALADSINLYAEENQYPTNLVELIDMVEPKDSNNGLLRTMTYYSNEDQQYYRYDVYSNKIDVFNENNELLLSATCFETNFDISSENNEDYISLAESASDYDKWTSYYYVRTDSLHWGLGSSITISVLTGLISSKFVGILASVATNIATESYNKKYEGLDAKIYWSHNTYCGILYKDRWDYYKEGTSTKVGSSEYRSAKWNGTAWEYSKPAACRVLVNKYPS